jgi:hypothetical protein
MYIIEEENESQRINRKIRVLKEAKHCKDIIRDLKFIHFNAKVNTSNKGIMLVNWLKWQSTCLRNIRPWIQTPVRA